MTYLHNIQLDPVIGNNRVFCKGRCVMGKKYYHMYLSILIATLPTILMTFILIKTLDISVYIPLILIMYYFYLFSSIFLFIAGATDPGILERNLDVFNKYYDDRKQYLFIRVQGHIQKFTFCYTCNILRPLRTSHCAECDNCIERFDHHCIWIGNCVGKRNYKYFFLFLLHLNVYGLFIIIVNCIIISQKFDAIRIGTADMDTIYTYIGLCFAEIFFIVCFIFFFLGKLFLLHLWLSIQNLTFYEHIKNKWDNFPYKNPFDRNNLWTNLYYVVCRRVPKANLEFSDQRKKKYVELMSPYV